MVTPKMRKCVKKRAPTRNRFRCTDWGATTPSFLMRRVVRGGLGQFPFFASPERVPMSGSEKEVKGDISLMQFLTFNSLIGKVYFRELLKRQYISANHKLWWKVPVVGCPMSESNQVCSLPSVADFADTRCRTLRSNSLCCWRRTGR